MDWGWQASDENDTDLQSGELGRLAEEDETRHDRHENPEGLKDRDERDGVESHQTVVQPLDLQQNARDHAKNDEVGLEVEQKEALAGKRVDYHFGSALSKQDLDTKGLHK
jgi:hypothetical protein